MDAVVRGFDRRINGMDEALDEGCTEAAEYLQECIENKFGPIILPSSFFLYSSVILGVLPVYLNSVSNVSPILSRILRTQYTLSSFSSTTKSCKDGLAAEYLQECIENKFGHYQPGWEHLKEETIRKKISQGNGIHAQLHQRLSICHRQISDQAHYRNQLYIGQRLQKCY